jgi:hypothetical protein
VLSPIGDEHLRFPESSEDLTVQKFVPKVAVERFDVAVFPGAAGLDEQCLDL